MVRRINPNSLQVISNFLKALAASHLLDQSAPVQGTSLTAGYEGQIRELWDKASIQKREQRMTREWDCKTHRTRHGKRE
jgi:hypothetical protein